jgi:hypothetical protein
MEPWWHDFYATMAQVIAVLLLATVVESPIRSSILGHDHWGPLTRWMTTPSATNARAWILIAMLWLCMGGGGLALWILSEETPWPWLVRVGQLIVGVPTAFLAVLIAIGVALQIREEVTHPSRNRTTSCKCVEEGERHGGVDAS